MQMGVAGYQYAGVLAHEVGDKRYELSNHLGNVLQVVRDAKLPKTEAVNMACFSSASSEYARTATAFNAGQTDKFSIEAWVNTTDNVGSQAIAAYYLNTSPNKGMVLFLINGKARVDGRVGAALTYSSGVGSTNVADGN